jgi:hypothetical protein
VPETSPIRFEAVLRTIGDRPILRLPDDASAQLSSRGQVAVNGVVGRQTFATVLEPDGVRGHWLEVHDEMRRALSLDEDDSVTVEIEPTKAWPEPDLPPDFRSALDAAPDLAEHWAQITPMARWEWVRWIKATKNPHTRSRRVEVSISKLRNGMRRPCCFDLASCTDPELSKNGKLIGVE